MSVFLTLLGETSASKAVLGEKFSEQHSLVDSEPCVMIPPLKIISNF